MLSLVAQIEENPPSHEYGPSVGIRAARLHLKDTDVGGAGARDMWQAGAYDAGKGVSEGVFGLAN